MEGLGCSVCMELVGYLYRGGSWDGEPECHSPGLRGYVGLADPDDFAPAVYDCTAGVSGADRGIGLDEVYQGLAAGRRPWDLPVQARDDAGFRRVLKSER